MSTETKYTIAIKTNEEHKGKKCAEMVNCSMQSYIEDKVLEVLTAINFGLDINDDEISIELEKVREVLESFEVKMASKELITKVEEDEGFRIALLNMISDGRINVTDGKFELTEKGKRIMRETS